MTLTKLSLLLFPFLVLALSYLNSGSHTHPNEVWIYASIYKEVITSFDEALKEEFPDVKIQWYQSGSENVAARVNSELSSGSSRADLVMTSDPFWFEELKDSHHLLSYRSPLADQLDSRYQDPDGMYVISRIPVGVIAYRKNSIASDQAPRSWDDLLLSIYKGKISMPSPLESGTALTFISQLSRAKDWNFFERLKKNSLLSAGGNSAVMKRIETNETPIGIVLLENALEAKKRGAPIEIVYPVEGVILVPSPMAILATTKRPELTKKIYDFFLTEKAQRIFLSAQVYSPILKNEAPEGALSFQQIQNTVFQWDPEVLKTLSAHKQKTKLKFTQMFLQ